MLIAGPSAPPEGVTADGMSTSITVQWGSVPCIHQNGVITEYSVRYGVEGSGSPQTVTATGNGATISDLTPSTNYTVQVAAVNSAGVGEYSVPIIVNTESKSDFEMQQLYMKSFFSPVAINLTVVGSTTNSISIRWEVIEEGTIDPSGYQISYRNTEYTEPDCLIINITISIDSDALGGEREIEDLQEGTDYSITVALLVSSDVTDRNTVIHATDEAGKSVYNLLQGFSLFFFPHSSLCCSHWCDCL